MSIPGPTLDDIGSTASTKDLTANSTMMLPSPRSEDLPGSNRQYQTPVRDKDKVLLTVLQS